MKSDVFFAILYKRKISLFVLLLLLITLNIRSFFFCILQFKQRGYTDPSFDRQLATTTGQMLNQTVDTLPNNLSTTASSVPNRRHPVNKIQKNKFF